MSGSVSSDSPAPVSDADSTVSEPKPTKTEQGDGAFTRWLPWALVALLTVCCVILATLCVDAHERIRELQSDAAPADPVAVSASPTASRITAAPTTGDKAASMLKLQRRDQQDQRALGKADAPIVLIEWADYRCPYCAKWHQESLQELVPYIKSGSLRVEFHDYVIFGEQSEAAARAARAAGMQGHFWDYSQLLWSMHTGSGHPEMTDAMLQDLASQAGVADVAKFNADRNSQAVKDAVAKETAEAQQLGLTATPFFLINTTTVPGAYPASTFVDIVKQYGGKPAQ